MMSKSSRIPGFYRLNLGERVEEVRRFAALSEEGVAVLGEGRGLSLDQAEGMVENVVGLYSLPLGIAVNFLINGRDYLIPMAIEEPSIVAGASHAAKLVRQRGGFFTESTGPVMIGQLQVLDVEDLSSAKLELLAAKEMILEAANAQHPTIASRGGGAKDLEVRMLDRTSMGPMLVVHLIYDTRDAMGANAVNTAVEAIAPTIAEITGGRVNLRILSNLADRRLVRARCRVPASALARGNLAGQEVIQRILEAQALAEADPYRAATHNKGIMNGVDAVALATGNDWRAIEAGAHAYAARSGR